MREIGSEFMMDSFKRGKNEYCYLTDYPKPYIFLRDVDVEPIILDGEEIFDDPKVRF